MLGNVWEWCQDDRRDYDKVAMTNPVGSLRAGADRVLHGGSWYDLARFVRAAYRIRNDPGDRSANIGFRCARPRFNRGSVVSTASKAGRSGAGHSSGRWHSCRPE